MDSHYIPLLTASFEKNFNELNLFQLNWKPSVDEWSIGQCMDHLIVSNDKYIPIFKEIFAGKHKQTFWEKYSPFSNYTGRQMIKTLGINVVKKYKTPKLFVPSKSNISQNIISEFIAQQDEIFILFERLEKPTYSSVVITSPIASLITLKLHDVIKVIIVHEHRHFNQAMNVKNHVLFPSK